MIHMPDRRYCTHDSPLHPPRIFESLSATGCSYAARALNVPAAGRLLMSTSTVSPRVPGLGVPISQPFLGVFSPNMTLAEKRGLCLNSEG